MINFSRYIHVPTHTQIIQIDLKFKDEKNTHTHTQTKAILRFCDFAFQSNESKHAFSIQNRANCAKININNTVIYFKWLWAHILCLMLHKHNRSPFRLNMNVWTSSAARLKQFSFFCYCFLFLFTGFFFLAKNIESIWKYFFSAKWWKSPPAKGHEKSNKCICLSYMCGCYFHSKYERKCTTYKKWNTKKNEIRLPSNSFPLIYSIFVFAYLLSNYIRKKRNNSLFFLRHLRNELNVNLWNEKKRKERKKTCRENERQTIEWREVKNQSDIS